MICGICQKEFSDWINPRHLKMHGISSKEYVEKHGPTMLGEYRERRIEKFRRAVEASGFSRKGTTQTREAREKISKRLVSYYTDKPGTRRGARCSSTTREKLSRAQKERFHKNPGLAQEIGKRNRRYYEENPHPLKGQHLPFETRKKISAKKQGRSVEKWRGFITEENLKLRTSPEYKKWRQSVFERDDFACRMCRKRGGELHADHIKPFCRFVELRFEVSNGRTLCAECHRKTPTYGSKASKYRPTEADERQEKENNHERYHP